MSTEANTLQQNSNNISELPELLKNAIQLYIQNSDQEAKKYLEEINGILKKHLESLKLLKTEVREIRKNLISAKAKPIEPAQIAGNTSYTQIQPTPVDNPSPINKPKKNSTLSDDLKILERRIIEGRSFNKDIKEKSVEERYEFIAKAFAKGEFLKGIMNMPEYKYNKSFKQILGEFIKEDALPDILASDIVQKIKEKERLYAQQHNRYKEIKIFRKKQKESNKGLISFIANVVVDNTIKNISRNL
jgi:hypothetical protein